MFFHKKTPATDATQPFSDVMDRIKGTFATGYEKDLMKAKKDYKDTFGNFEYKIPPAVYSVIDMYDKMYTGGLPGKDIIQDQIGAGYAGAMGNLARGADTSAGFLGAGTALSDRFMSSVRDLSVQDETMKVQQEQEKLMGQIAGQTMMADYEKERDVNIPYADYQRKLNEANAREVAAMQTKYNAQNYAEQKKMANKQLLFGLAGTVLGGPIGGALGSGLGGLFGGGGGNTMQPAPPVGYNTTPYLPSAPMPSAGASIPTSGTAWNYDYNSIFNSSRF